MFMQGSCYLALLFLVMVHPLVPFAWEREQGVVGATIMSSA